MVATKIRIIARNAFVPMDMPPHFAIMWPREICRENVGKLKYIYIYFKLIKACPGESNLLLTEAQPELKELRWYNSTNFTCYWRIQAPADHYIEVKFEQLDGFKCDQSCYNFFEVKYGNMANSGNSNITYLIKYLNF